MNKVLQDFTDFIREQGVVGLAVGFVLGTAVKDVVSSFIDNIVNPVLGVFLGRGEALKEMSLQIGNVEIMWGSFISTLIDFLVIAAVVYYGIKILNLSKLDKKKE